HYVAPVANMLENQQACYHLGREALPATTAALGTSLSQSLVDDGQEVFICQNLVGMPHPIFPQIVHLGGDQSIAEGQLFAPHPNHGTCSCASIVPLVDAEGRG